MIEARVSNYSRPQILQVLDEIQQYVYSQNVSETQYIDGDTGLPPILRTRRGHLKYNCPSTCRETAVIFTLDPPRSYYQMKYPPNWERTYYYQGKEYYRVPVTTRQATNGVLATVKFPFDPGTSKDRYYHLFYLKPPVLDTEAVQMIIPENLHLFVRRAVISLLSSEEFGENGIDYQILDDVAKRVRNQLNRSLQLKIGKTLALPEYRDYISSLPRGW